MCIRDSSQLQHVTGEEVKQEEKKEEHSKEVQELVYKYPTRSRITRARILEELGKLKEDIEENSVKGGPENVKTSIFNKSILVRKDQ